MKAIVVLLVLALAAFARADEQVMGQAISAAVADEQGVADLAVDTDMDVAEDEVADEDEAVEEDEAEAEDEEEAVDEADAEDESEADEAEEDEFSLIEAEAEAETDEERRRSRKGKKSVKVVRAPRALKSRPFKFHPERVRADSTKPTDPELEKLDLALAAVKEDILSTNKQITDERKWVIAVAKIIAAYNDKMKRVEAHIIALRKEMKSLYRKKKQIENLKLQKALEAKLKEAKAEHQTLLDSLKHVKVKSSELNKSGIDLRNTIAGITAQLKKLRGETVRKPRGAVRGSRKGRKARKAGKKCGKGKRYSRKAKKCVARKARKAAAKKF